jgi:hypothetical protein
MGRMSKEMGTRITKESNGLITLAKFEKTNGAVGGRSQNQYELDYAMVIQFTDDCWWGDALTEKLNFTTVTGDPRPDDFLLNTPFYGKIKARKGETVSRSGKLWLEKTERGWRDHEGHLY